MEFDCYANKECLSHFFIIVSSQRVTKTKKVIISWKLSPFSGLKFEFLKFGRIFAYKARGEANVKKFWCLTHISIAQQQVTYSLASRKAN